MSITRLPNGKYLAKARGVVIEAFTRTGAIKIAAKRVWENSNGPR